MADEGRVAGWYSEGCFVRGTRNRSGIPDLFLLNIDIATLVAAAFVEAAGRCRRSAAAGYPAAAE